MKLPVRVHTNDTHRKRKSDDSSWIRIRVVSCHKAVPLTSTDATCSQRVETTHAKAFVLSGHTILELSYGIIYLVIREAAKKLYLFHACPNLVHMITCVGVRSPLVLSCDEELTIKHTSVFRHGRFIIFSCVISVPLTTQIDSRTTKPFRAEIRINL